MDRSCEAQLRVSWLAKFYKTDSKLEGEGRTGDGRGAGGWRRGLGATIRSESKRVLVTQVANRPFMLYVVVHVQQDAVVAVVAVLYIMIICARSRPTGGGFAQAEANVGQGSQV